MEPARPSGVRGLFKDTVVYGLATAAARSTWLVLFPIYAIYYGVEDFGALELFLAITTLLVALAAFGQDSSLLRYFNERTEGSVRRNFVGQCIAIQAAGVCLIVLLAVLMPDLAKQLVDHPQGAQIFWLILLQVPFQLLTNTALTVLRARFATRSYLVVALGNVLLQVPANIVALVVFQADLKALFQINLAIAVITALVALTFIRSDLSWPRTLGDLPPLLVYGVPMWAIVVVSALQPAVDRALASSLLGPADLGRYAAGARVAMLISLPIQAFQIAWYPQVMAKYKDEGFPHFFDQVLKALTVALGGLVLALTALSPLVLMLIDAEKYAGADLIVFPVAMGLVLQGISMMTGVGTVLAAKPYLRLVSFLASLAVEIGMTMILAPRLGILGVAIATLSGQALKWILETWFGRAVWPLRMPLVPIVSLVLAVTGAGMSYVLLRMSSDVTTATMVLVASSAAIVAGAWYGVIDATQRAGLIGLFRRGREEPPSSRT